MERVVSRKLKQLLFACAFALLPLANAHAITIAANTTYELSGDLIFVTESVDGVFLWYGAIQPGSTYDLGALNSNIFATADASMSGIQFNIYNFNAQGQTGALVGTATGTMTFDLGTVHYSPGAGAGAGLSDLTGHGDLIGMNGTINGNAFAYTTPLVNLPTRMPDGLAGGIYDNVNSAFAGDYSLVFGNLGVGFTSNLLYWFQGSTTLFGHSTYIHGDLHGALADVPEPATLALLGVACLGGLSRRRRAA